MRKNIKYVGIILVLMMLLIPYNIVPVNASDESSREQIWDNPPLDTSNATRITGRILQESEYYHIPLSKEFIINNGNSLDSPELELSFPESWLLDPPPIIKDAIILRVPKEYVSQHDKDKSPYIVSATFFHNFIQGLPKASPPPPPPIIPEDVMRFHHSLDDSATSQPIYKGTRNIEYLERWVYKHTGDYITGAAGYIYPSQYSNPDGETFLTYQEIEYHFDTLGDAIEVVNCFRDDWDTPRVAFGVYVNTSLTITDFLPVDLGDYVPYDLYVDYSSPSHYDCNLYIGDTTYNYPFSDSSPANNIDSMQPSCEIDTRDGIQNSFSAYTYPIGLTNLKTTSWQGSSYVPQVLYRYSYDPDADYVGVYCYLGSNSLQAYLSASDSI